MWGKEESISPAGLTSIHMLEAQEALLTAALMWDMDFLERVMFYSIWKKKKKSKPPNPSRKEIKVCSYPLTPPPPFSAALFEEGFLHFYYE